MDVTAPGYWLAIALPAVATFLGVVLAFWLERVAERRRQEAAAFWAARHSTKAIAQAMTDLPHDSLMRALVNGRGSPRRADVYRQLAEVDPDVAWLWLLAVNGMVRSYDRGFWFKRPPNRRLWRRANSIDRALYWATRPWPMRRKRIADLKAALERVPSE